MSGFNPDGGDGYEFWVGSLMPSQRESIYDYTGDIAGYEGAAYANANPRPERPRHDGLRGRGDPGVQLSRGVPRSP